VIVSDSGAFIDIRTKVVRHGLRQIFAVLSHKLPISLRHFALQAAYSLACSGIEVRERTAALNLSGRTDDLFRQAFYLRVEPLECFDRRLFSNRIGRASAGSARTACGKGS